MNRGGKHDQVDALRDEIAHTRAELGETVQELAARADVPARARASAQRAAQRARTASSSPRFLVTVAAAAAVAVGSVVLWSLRRRGTRVGHGNARTWERSRRRSGTTARRRKRSFAGWEPGGRSRKRRARALVRRGRS